MGILSIIGFPLRQIVHRDQETSWLHLPFTPTGGMISFQRRLKTIIALLLHIRGEITPAKMQIGHTIHHLTRGGEPITMLRNKRKITAELVIADPPIFNGEPNHLCLIKKLPLLASGSAAGAETTASLPPAISHPAPQEEITESSTNPTRRRGRPRIHPIRKTSVRLSPKTFS
ncbi:unnamed protein product, partial [Eruca vesicaria subsp. sativa]|nr:unnamed protein product [Eruca vesicaria subsp. sativa]